MARLIKHWPDELSGLFAFEVGLSGGLDSVALLSLLCAVRAQRPDLQLSAVHVHHGLSPNADAWAEHCRRLCADLDVSLRVERVSVRVAGGDSVEAVAREARYRVYRQSAAQVIVLAHHLDDQAETVLLQLLRGGGVRALAAMPELRALDEARMLWRPLLDVTRAELEAYAHTRNLGWVEDESNQDTRYRRNLLRHDILPRIEQAIPHYRQHLARAASLQADAAALLDEVSAADLAACRSLEGGLDGACLAGLSPVRQRHALLAWLQDLGWPAPQPAALCEFLRQLDQAGVETCPVLQLPTGSLLRFGGVVQAWPVLPPPQAVALPTLDPERVLALPGWGGLLRWEWREMGLAATLLAEGLLVQPRQGGERLAGRMGRRAVKDLLREAGLPPLLRQRWPLLYSCGGELLAVPGVAVSRVHAAAPGWWPIWQASGPESLVD